MIRIVQDSFWVECNAQVGDAGGVYRIVVKQEGVRATIPRLLEADETGLLYIGKGEPLTRRMSQLATCIQPDYADQKHTFGETYNVLPAVEKRFPRESLFVELQAEADPREAEAEMLEEYLQRFGELPPFNRQG